MADEAVLNANGSILTPPMVRMAFNQIKNAGKTPTSCECSFFTAAQLENVGTSLTVYEDKKTSSTLAGCEITRSRQVPQGTIIFRDNESVLGKIINIGEPHAR